MALIAPLSILNRVLSYPYQNHVEKGNGQSWMVRIIRWGEKGTKSDFLGPQIRRFRKKLEKY